VSLSSSPTLSLASYLLYADDELVLPAPLPAVAEGVFSTPNPEDSLSIDEVPGFVDVTALVVPYRPPTVGEALDPNEELAEVLPAAAEVLLVPVPLTAPLALPLTAAWLLIGGLMALMPEVIEAEPEGDIAAETGLVGREEDGLGCWTGRPEAS
jgi:hypothetical protein